MPVDLNHRRIKQNEVRVYTICQKSFARQYRFLMENFEDLYTNYRYNIELCYNLLNNEHVHLYPEKWWDTEYGEEPLAGFWRAMGVNDMILDIAKPISNAVEKWYKKRYRKRAKVLNDNGFSYYNDVISNYAKEFGELNLSNYRGAISYTTKHDVINVLKDGIDNNLSVEDLAKNITALNDRLFSKARARTIATTEVGKAYEYGNYMPVQQLQSVGIQVKKYWLTCNDTRVRPEHMACEDEGRKPLDYVYPSVGVEICPEGVNCRCTMEYDFDL